MNTKQAMKIGAKMKVLENLEESQGKIAGTIMILKEYICLNVHKFTSFILSAVTKIYNVHLSVISTSRQILKDGSDF